MKFNTRRDFIRGVSLGSLGLSARTFSGDISDNDTRRQKLPVINEVDICVLGGSCTGVFAAVRAARLGAKVAIV